MTNSLAQEKNDFSLIGCWINEVVDTSEESSIIVELVFETDTTVTVKLIPGNKFHFNYSINAKSGFHEVQFKAASSKSIKLPRLIFKVMGKDSIKVQVLDEENQETLWDKNESIKNTRILKRVI